MNLFLTTTLSINENFPVVFNKQILSTSLEGKAQCWHNNTQDRLNQFGAAELVNQSWISFHHFGAQREGATWLSSLGHIKIPSKAMSGACLDQGAGHDTGAVSRSNSQVRVRQRGKPTVGVTGSPPKSLQCLRLKGKNDYNFDAWSWSLLVNFSRANKTVFCVLAWN